MTINPSIFKGYDIRGIYPTDLNEENVVPIVKAIYSFLHKDLPENEQLTVVVGTDMRISSPILTKAAIETLVEMGSNVIDIGIVSTPTFYFAVSHYGYPAGFQITASHNPREWNGIKIVKSGPNGLIKIGKAAGLDEIKNMAINNESINPLPNGTVTKKTDILGDEVANAMKIVGNSQIGKFKIVADASNAMGSQYINALFEKIPQDLLRMNFELDGTFPVHQPDPLQFDTLTDLQARVLSEKADLGLAPDGDGDRLFFIDEKGQVVPGTMITALVAREILRDHPEEKILFEIRNILTPKKIVEEYGGIPIVTKVGHAFITEALNETKGIFAGEGSGHYFFKDTGNAESQIVVILFVLKVLTRDKKSLSQVIDELRRSYESGEINYKVSNASQLLELVKEKYSNAEISTQDGVTVTYPDWRMNLRTSNTEPLLRLNVEACAKEIMEKKRDEVVEFIESHAKR